MSPLADYETRIRESFPEALVDARVELGTGVLVVRTDALVDVMTFIRDELGFDMLMDVCGVDWLPREPRFDVNYHLQSLSTGHRIRVKVHPDNEAPAVASVVDVWPTADWLEREVYDLMGIVFKDHPHLRRILMPDEWIGHPLRKDYPVGGVPVEYKIEPAYVGSNVVGDRARPAAGGVPARLRSDRGRASHWTWTGAPASGVRREPGPQAPTDEEPPEKA